MLKYALWVNRVTTKQAVGTSPFQLVYGIDAIFLVQMALPVMNFMHDGLE